MEVLTAVGASIAIAVGIGLYTFFGKFLKKDGEKFEPYKAVRTVAVGIVLGIVAYLAGFEITSENYAEYLAANGFAVGIVDQGLKILWRGIGNLKG